MRGWISLKLLGLPKGMRVRIRLVLGLLVLLAANPAGCGGGSSSNPPVSGLPPSGLWMPDRVWNSTTSSSVVNYPVDHHVGTLGLAAINESDSLEVSQKVVFDASGGMWVTNCPSAVANTADKVLSFSPAQIAALSTKAGTAPVPKSIITDDGSGESVACPVGAAFDQFGSLWVANDIALTKDPSPSEPANIVMFAPSQLTGRGSRTPSRILHGDGVGSLSNPSEIRFDGSGNLWVADYNAVEEYSASQLIGLRDQRPGPTPQLTITDPVNVDGVFTVEPDSDGNLWVASCLDNRVVQYAVDDLQGSGTISPTPRLVIAADADNRLNCPNGMALDIHGALWIANYTGNSNIPARIIELVNYVPGIAFLVPAIFKFHQHDTAEPSYLQGGADFGGPFLITFVP